MNVEMEEEDLLEKMSLEVAHYEKMDLEAIHYEKMGLE